MTKPRLTELIDLERDIIPYDMSLIYAGVGAGKNSIIMGYHKDKIDYVGLAEKYRVLLITSRKAKVTETKNDDSGHKILVDIRKIDTVKWDKLKNKSVVCTSAHFQKRVEDWWDPIFDDKPFWEEFDFIVIDEFHSIVTDATFANSSCIIYYFIDHLYNECVKHNGTNKHKTKVVLMSGTPEPATPLLEGYNLNILDKRIEAFSITPDQYLIYNYQYTLKQILKTLKAGKRVVYYFTLFNKLEDIISEALKSGIKEEQIVVSVSDANVNKYLEKNYNTIFNNKEIFENNLASEHISDEHLLILTNGKNKEGINIKEKIGLLAIETHFGPDIAQICGRFRNGIESAIIIEDAQQFTLTPFYDEEENYQRNYAIESANRYLFQIFKEENIKPQYESVYQNERVLNFISYIEKGTRFLRYNPFKFKFDFNQCYLQAFQFYNQSIAKFKHFLEDPTIIQSFDPDKSLSIRIKTNYAPPEEVFEMYVEEKGYIIGETVLTPQDVKRILCELNDLLRRVTKNPKVYTQFKSLVKMFGYDTVRVGKSERGQFRLIKREKD